MNEEEKRSIKFTKEYLEEEKNLRDDYKWKSGFYANGDIERLLNLIEKQQKVIDEMAKQLVDLPIPNSQEENILFFNSLDVKKFFYKKDEIKGKIEELASNEHSRWANWQKYVHSICIKNEDGSLTIPKEYVEHWEYEINTEYKDLPEKIKESDRKEVRQILELLGE